MTDESDELVEAAEPSLRATLVEWARDPFLCRVMIAELAKYGYEVSLPETPMFTCPDCGAVSYHPCDLLHGYCGRCHAFTRRSNAPSTHSEDTASDTQSD